MADLTDFLLARIAEDEAVAWATLEPVRNVHTGEDIGFGTEWEWYQNKVDKEWGEADHPGEQHVARHDPDRVLARCAAYRRIVEDFETLHEDYRTTHDRTTEARRLQAAISLGHLAAIWADRADYRDEWLP